MNKPLALTVTAALGTAAFLTGSAPEARANELLDLSIDRTRLVHYMPGEVGVGVALVFEGTSDHFVHGIIWDLERQRALEVEMEMYEMVPQGGALPYEHYGSISGDVFLPADSSGPREWVGSLEGEWSLDGGLGHLAGAIFGRDAADQPELAGLIEGDFYVEEDGSIRIDPTDDANGIPPFSNGGPGWTGGGTGGGSGVGGENTGSLDFGFGGAGNHSGMGFGNGIDVDVDGAGGGFDGAGIDPVGPGEADGTLVMRWKIFD